MKGNKLMLLITIVGLMFAIVTVSYSWFLVSKSIDISFDSDLTVDARNGLEISLDNGTTWVNKYQTAVTFGDILDVSGTGINLYTPTGVTGTDNDIPTGYALATANTLTSPNNDGDYILLNIMFRSKSELSVYFSGSSYITPTSTLTNNNTSSYGSFTTNYIAGASRMAILNSTGDERIMEWIPNTSYELTYTSGATTATFNESGTKETNYYYINGTTDLTEYTESVYDYYTGDVILNSTLATAQTQGNSKTLVTLSDYDSTTLYYSASIIMKVWIEGTDRESMIPLSGGKVKMKFLFLGSTKTLNSTWETNIASITDQNDLLDGMYIASYSTVSSQGLTGFTAYTTSSTFTTGTIYYAYYPGTTEYMNSTIKYFTAS